MGKEALQDNTAVAEGRSVLDREWDFYWNNRDEIVRQYRDRYVVIAYDKVVAAYDDENEAYFQTVRDIPLGSFMIHHVTEPEEIIQVSPGSGRLPSMSKPARRALKHEYIPIPRKLTSAVEVVGISAQNPGQKVTARALWDTGAESSLISPEISKQLGLIPIGSARIYGVNTVSRADMVKATVILPNNIRIPNITILVCSLIPNTDMLVGMDIIGRGDFVISNGGGGTLFTFAVPPFEDKTDLYEKWQRENDD